MLTQTFKHFIWQSSVPHEKLPKSWSLKSDIFRKVDPGLHSFKAAVLIASLRCTAGRTAGWVARYSTGRT
jgi:hypothetical protein